MEGTLMPIYVFKCGKCGKCEEHILAIAARDHQMICACGAIQHRLLTSFTIGKQEHQTKAILGSGAKVKGHFGKEAKSYDKKKSKRAKRRSKG